MDAIAGEVEAGGKLREMSVIELSEMDNALCTLNNVALLQGRCLALCNMFALHLSDVIENNNNLRQHIIMEMKSRTWLEGDESSMRLRAVHIWAYDCGVTEQETLRQLNTFVSKTKLSE